MTQIKFKPLIEKLKLQHLPDGDVEVFDIDTVEINPFLKISNSISHLTIEKDNEFILISKITPKVYLHLKAEKSFYNIGILKNISLKISNELRSNAIFTSK